MTLSHVAKQAVRMAQTKGSIAEVSHELGLPEHTLFNWVKAVREGRLLPAAGTGRAVSAEQMELARLRAELSPAALGAPAAAPSASSRSAAHQQRSAAGGIAFSFFIP